MKKWHMAWIFMEMLYYGACRFAIPSQHFATHVSDAYSGHCPYFSHLCGRCGLVGALINGTAAFGTCSAHGPVA